MHRFMPTVVLATLLSGSALAATDIAGITIGAPLSGQRQAIAKVNPSYQFNDIKLANGKTVGVNAIAQNAGRVTDQFVVIQNDSGIVWFVARAQALEKGSRIKPETLLNSLKDKYGPYTVSFGSPRWQFDRQGQIYQGQSSVRGPCDGGIGTGVYTTFEKVPGAGIHVPRNFTPKCGTEINTSFLKDSTDGMVSAFAVQIVDAKRMYDDLNGKAVSEENERKRKLDAEKGKDVKPKL